MKLTPQQVLVLGELRENCETLAKGPGHRVCLSLLERGLARRTREGHFVRTDAGTKALELVQGATGEQTP